MIEGSLGNLTNRILGMLGRFFHIQFYVTFFLVYDFPIQIHFLIKNSTVHIMNLSSLEFDENVSSKHYASLTYVHHYIIQ